MPVTNTVSTTMATITPTSQGRTMLPRASRNTTSSPISMTKLQSRARTVAKISTWRGNHTFLMSPALPSSATIELFMPLDRKFQARSPHSRKAG